MMTMVCSKSKVKTTRNRTRQEPIKHPEFGILIGSLVAHPLWKPVHVHVAPDRITASALGSGCSRSPGVASRLPSNANGTEAVTILPGAAAVDALLGRPHIG